MADLDLKETQFKYRQRLFFESGLYEAVRIESHRTGGVFAEGLRHDAYCVECRQGSTFVLQAPPEVVVMGSPHRVVFDSGVRVHEFRCSREPDHIITFAIMSFDDGEAKIGQWPTIADIAFGELRQFDSVMSKEDRDDLGRAIGLHAHGVGAGSFVYLRRILERLVAEAERTAGRTPEQGERVADRIKHLKGTLPPFLTDNAPIYGILSRGVHEMPEEECIAAFAAVRAGIECIIEQKLAIARKAEVERRAAAGLAQLQKNLGRPNSG